MVLIVLIWVRGGGLSCMTCCGGGSPVSGLIRGYGVWGLSDWLAWYGGLGYWVDRLCGWVLAGSLLMFLGMSWVLLHGYHGYHVIV